METYKQEFIEFMVRAGALTFGAFVTKSGRATPYFINTGNYTRGSQMARLGEFYAEAIRSALGGGFNVLFGPAYKGIPLAASTAIALQRAYGHDVSVCFNRKEAKDHGEGGTIIGHKPAAGDRVVIVDDVITAGTSLRESAALLLAVPGVTLSALAVSVDRMEKGPSGVSALAEASKTYTMAAVAIVTIDEIVSYLHGRAVDGIVHIDDAMKAKIDEYRAEYGA
jgi:orotate phosphoribosyltransferase